MYEAIVNGKTIKPGIEAVLVRIDELTTRRIEGIRRAAGNKLLEVAANALGPTTPLVIRGLAPLDLGEDTDEYFEETITANNWTTISVADTTVADNRFIAFTGCRIILEITGGGYAKLPLITTLKFTVGGSLVAKWDMYPLYIRCGATSGVGAGAISMPSVAGISESPIIISQNMPFKVEAYGYATAKAIVSFDGLTCEPVGKVLKP